MAAITKVLTYAFDDTTSDVEVLKTIAMFCGVGLTVPLGFTVRDTFYGGATAQQVAQGGRVFNSASTHGSCILMGDSHGGMYALVTRYLCQELDWKFTAACVGGLDPLPSLEGPQSQLWLDSLALVKNNKPDCLILVCDWRRHDDDHRIRLAVDALTPHVGRLLILNQPPVLPKTATRDAIRGGQKPPFYEDPETTARRTKANARLGQFGAANCKIIDVASYFQTAQGDIPFVDEEGNQLYQDASHPSAYGANRIRTVLKDAIADSRTKKSD